MKKYSTSVIIINYNSADYTIACIKSIIDFVDKDFSYNIVVVDNNSKDDDYESLFSHCTDLENVKIVRSKINLGFSGGNMFGIQYTNAEYVFFLNNDTLLLNDCISTLYEFMIKHKDVGICTGQMYNTDMTFHHSFNYFPTLKLKLFGSSFLRLLEPKKYPKKSNEYIDPLKVDFVTGAAMYIDYLKFSEIGGFDTNFFLYCEEEDIAMKLKQAGYSASLVPQAKFIHHMGKSTKRNLDTEKENFISLLYYHRKYSSLIVYILLKILYFIKKIKYFYKTFDYVKLAIFIMSGADLKYSMKHKQKINIR